MNRYAGYLSNENYVIFLFHGVISEYRHQIRNYNRKHLSRDLFIEFLKQTSSAGTAVTMDEIVQAHNGKYKLPQKAFTITFDDGFANNYHIAAPVLADLNIPATFYITTGFIEENGLSWIDLVENAFELKNEVVIELFGERKTAGNTKEKIDLLEQIRQRVKTDPSVEPYDLARDITDQLGKFKPAPDPELDQKMNWQQVTEMNRNEIFTIGGHGHTHRILGFLPPDQCKEEVEKSLSLLEEKLGQNIKHFSYPEGMPNCYDDLVIGLLKKYGIKCAPSAVSGVNSLTEDLFHLKRITVT